MTVCRLCERQRRPDQDRAWRTDGGLLQCDACAVWSEQIDGLCQDAEEHIRRDALFTQYAQSPDEWWWL